MVVLLDFSDGKVPWRVVVKHSARPVFQCRGSGNLHIYISILVVLIIREG